ncbi:hypothetical protein [Burkholderia vietnamiensis]|uniref:hypothetical protein n=1 Tax=Burkholderia vietnamiensis TaxID=60552 RepID=UPI0012D94836|nr:hypothetical protein [Burkholderia vietnamiensis]MBR8150025.1 hypothetical protein [Burkholderia vietnamiensis]
MDKFEQRWRALVRLKDQLGRGGAAHIAREIGKEPNYISRALYPPGKDGRKRIGEDTAELLDAKFPGWMSEQGWGGSNATPGDSVPANSRIEPPKGWGMLRDDQRAAIEQLIETMLTDKVALANTEPPPGGLIGD